MDTDKIFKWLVSVVIIVFIIAVLTGWLYDFQEANEKIKRDYMDLIKIRDFPDRDCSQECLSLH